MPAPWRPDFINKLLKNRLALGREYNCAAALCAFSSLPIACCRELD